MEYIANTLPVNQHVSPCMIVGIDHTQQLSASAQQLDECSGGYLQKRIQAGDITGKLGELLLLHDVPNIRAERVLIVGYGDPKQFTMQKYQKIIQKASKKIKEIHLTHACCCLCDLPVIDSTLLQKLGQALLGIDAAHYCFDQFKTKETNNKSPLPKHGIHNQS